MSEHFVKDSDKHQVIYVMGVSGCGKSTIGKTLAEKLNFLFFDGDDFHSEENVLKMSKGQPLNDDDRQGWLEAINRCALEKSSKSGVVIACSALKKSYRDILETNIDPKPKWVYLKGNYDLIHERMKGRIDHFMPATLLKNQFDTLEPPGNCIRINVEKSVNGIVSEIHRKLAKQI
ncbi:MAG: gluconokinase [Bacteroidota bacterium]